MLPLQLAMSCLHATDRSKRLMLFVTVSPVDGMHLMPVIPCMLQLSPLSPLDISLSGINCQLTHYYDALSVPCWTGHYCVCVSHYIMLMLIQAEDNDSRRLEKLQRASLDLASHTSPHSYHTHQHANSTPSNLYHSAGESVTVMDPAVQHTSHYHHSHGHGSSSSLASSSHALNYAQPHHVQEDEAVTSMTGLVTALHHQPHQQQQQQQQLEGRQHEGSFAFPMVGTNAPPTSHLDRSMAAPPHNSSTAIPPAYPPSSGVNTWGNARYQDSALYAPGGNPMMADSAHAGNVLVEGGESGGVITLTPQEVLQELLGDLYIDESSLVIGAWLCNVVSACMSLPVVTVNYGLPLVMNAQLPSCSTDHVQLPVVYCHVQQ